VLLADVGSYSPPHLPEIGMMLRTNCPLLEIAPSRNDITSAALCGVSDKEPTT
jgi:hypothetical protein